MRSPAPEQVPLAPAANAFVMFPCVCLTLARDASVRHCAPAIAALFAAKTPVPPLSVPRVATGRRPVHGPLATQRATDHAAPFLPPSAPVLRPALAPWPLSPRPSSLVPPQAVPISAAFPPAPAPLPAFLSRADDCAPSTTQVRCASVRNVAPRCWPPALFHATFVALSYPLPFAPAPPLPAA